MKIQFSGENLFCNLINTKDDEFICTICENRYIVPDFDIDLPKLLCKKVNFIVALIKHLLNGGKRTSKEERDRRYSICQGCEFFDKSSCTQCGCPISRHEKFISKLDWANQHCPVGKW